MLVDTTDRPITTNERTNETPTATMVSISNTFIIFTYYLLYKFIQQNVYIDILRRGSTNGGILNGFWSRLIALALNFIHSTVIEFFFVSKPPRKVLLSIYASLLIILLYVSRQMSILEITFFALNLTLCESLIFRSFLDLWQIQLCLELSIVANYCIKETTGQTPLYLIWIFSILLPHINLDDGNKLANRRRQQTHKQRLCTCHHHNIPVTTTRPPRQHRLRERFKYVIYTLLQVFLSVSYLLVGCTTIRNTIFQIFHTRKYTLSEVLLLVAVICVLVISSCLVAKFKQRTKIIVILVLVTFNYIVVFVVEQRVVDMHEKTVFFVDIIMKKLLCLTKCCIMIFLTRNSHRHQYKGLRYRMIKFFVLNSDTLSYIVNFMLHDRIDVNFLNIYIVIVVLILYNLFISC